MIFFGEHIPPDAPPDRVLASAPPLRCIDCDRLIQPHETGVVLPAMDADGVLSSVAMHRACLLANIGIPLAQPPCDK